MAELPPNSMENGARINIELPDEIKDVIERAALISELTVTDFAINTLVNSANKVLKYHKTRTLSDRDRDHFLSILDADEEPNEALIETIEEHKRLTSE